MFKRKIFLWCTRGYLPTRFAKPVFAKSWQMSKNVGGNGHGDQFAVRSFDDQWPIL